MSIKKLMEHLPATLDVAGRCINSGVLDPMEKMGETLTGKVAEFSVDMVPEDGVGVSYKVTVTVEEILRGTKH